MDVLSEILKSVTLEGALFYNAEFSAPWGVLSPESRRVAPVVAPQGGHVIIFHLLTEGRGSARLPEGDTLPLEAGDVVVLPHGDEHILENGSPRVRQDNGKELQRVIEQGLRVARMGGGGELTKFVCGYMVCEPRLSRIVLSGLPPIFKVNIRADDAGRWIESTIRFSVDQAGGAHPGGEAVLAKLSEVLFVETLRRYVERWPEGRAGWLAGARDPEVGRALALMHRRPAHPWTLADLAREAGISRSVLAERFRQFMSQPPMAYLTRWRLQLGARLLVTTSRSVADVAVEVGYESEAAFNRAFKRSFGAPPAKYRQQAKPATRPALSAVRKPARNGAAGPPSKAHRPA